ncbi:MAG: hypothetical protein WAS33_24540 [Candidatus Promineifilaceae bacterium]
MPDFEEKHKYNVSGSIWLDLEKVWIELTGIRIKKEKVLANSIGHNMHSLKFQRQVPVPFQLDSVPDSENSLFQEREESELRTQSLEDDLAMLLLEIPGIKDADPQKRYELIRIIDDPKLRRETRKKNIGEKESPEDYIRSLIDYVILLDQLEKFLAEIANLDVSPEFNRSLLKWKVKYASKRNTIHEFPPASRDNPRSKLHKEMCRTFDLEEINTLCFHLKIASDEISGARISVKCRNLIQYVERMGRLPELVFLLKEHRPNGHWEYPPD